MHASEFIAFKVLIVDLSNLVINIFEQLASDNIFGLFPKEITVPNEEITKSTKCLHPFGLD